MVRSTEYRCVNPPNPSENIEVIAVLRRGPFKRSFCRLTSHVQAEPGVVIRQLYGYPFVVAQNATAMESVLS